MDFKNLHYQNTPLLLANVWDVPSARIAEKLAFKAIGTSSSAIASILGYNDGEEMSFSELAYMVKRIASCTHLPLSVDLESGYSREPLVIFNHIKHLASIGVVGINLEDSIVVKGEREQLSSSEFSNTIGQVKTLLEKEKTPMFINIRTDGFLLNQPDFINETKKRIQAYEKAGADGIFIPCMEETPHIETMVNATSLPVNIMCMPNLPGFEDLSNLGVKRISMGNFMFENMYSQFEQTTKRVLKENSFKSLF